jgi:hypothetical protein
MTPDHAGSPPSATSTRRRRTTAAQALFSGDRGHRATWVRSPADPGADLQVRHCSAACVQPIQPDHHDRRCRCENRNQHQSDADTDPFQKGDAGPPGPLGGSSLMVPSTAPTPGVVISSRSSRPATKAERPKGPSLTAPARSVLRTDPHQADQRLHQDDAGSFRSTTAVPFLMPV